MPLSHDVNLPLTHEPLYPNRCVACGIPSPDNVLFARACDIAPLSWLFQLRRRVIATPPACSRCCSRYRRRRWARRILEIVIIVAGVWIAMTLIPHGTPARTWISVGIVGVAMVPMLVWQMLRPLPFDLTQLSKSVDFEFSDGAYAREFARLNNSRVK